MKTSTAGDNTIAIALLRSLGEHQLPTKERRELKAEFAKRFPKMMDKPLKPQKKSKEPLPMDCLRPDEGTMEMQIPW